MNKKETINSQEARNQKLKSKKMNTSEKSTKKKNKELPWWIELLFVQIGLPDKFLINILKTKKQANTLIKNDKKALIKFLFVIIALGYFYPIIKYSKNILDCEVIAKNYIIQNKNINGIDKRELRMLTTNFCQGGNEIYEIENSKN